MAITLNVIGGVTISIKDLSGVPVTQEVEKNISDELAFGRYTISTKSNTIQHIDALEKPLYNIQFNLDVENMVWRKGTRF